MPYPPLDGGAQVMHFSTLGLLANNVDVKVLAIDPSRNFVDVSLLPEEYISSTQFEAVHVDTAIKPVKIIANLFKKDSYFIERFISREFDSKLQSVLQNETFDIVQLEHLYLCKYINTIKKFSEAKIILRPQNIEYIIWERYINNLKGIFRKYILKIATRRLMKYETGVGKYLDGIMALTKEDVNIFKSFSGNTPVIKVPMGYNYNNLKNYNFESQYSHVPTVYHLGSMDWLPNIEAVEWFIKKIVPLLEKSGLPLKIIIAGKKMPSRIFKNKSKILDIIGDVVSPLEFQEQKQIMIVPLLSGSGIRAKIIEGLALGKTIISTSIGAQGIEYENGKNILIADTPVEFAELIIKCVTFPELCIEIGKNARELSINKYHYEHSAKKNEEILQ